MTDIECLKINKDTFFYSLKESDSARRKKDGSLDSHLRFEKFLFGKYVKPKKLTLNTFKSELTEVANALFQLCPQFRKSETITLENISYFSLAITTLLFDFETLLKSYTGKSLPTLPDKEVDYSDFFPHLRLVIGIFNSPSVKNEKTDEAALPVENPLFPLQWESLKLDKDLQEAISLKAENAEDQKIHFESEIWALLTDIIHDVFATHSEAILAYVFWRYQIPQKSKPVDWRVRPPVGNVYLKYFGLDRRDRFKKDNDRFSGDKKRDAKSGGQLNSRSGNNKTARKSYESDGLSTGLGTQGNIEPNSDLNSETRSETLVQEKPSDYEGKKEFSDRKKPEKLDSKNHFSDIPIVPTLTTVGSAQFKEFSRKSKAEQGSDKREARSQNPGSEAHAASAEAEEEALNQVYKALERLKKDPNLKELALPPVNSYLRRQQHSLATELGMVTESRGEGKLRTIYLKLGTTKN